MGRNARNHMQPCVYHVTHRCHGRSPKLTLTPFDETPTVAEDGPTYALLGPKREPQEAWRIWMR